eukprot:CAMPEP_0197422772 /NCGR_PEP_ID=MMETSP1170-20131217/17384_1 /TAXON_ID=54406 /ORGANISM="Sarcinochrysis sp, Strain CCMP770" /LENGTH=47 /DNA_ID= /DNA_START= /DNA_END= /DNA_ORIENTATION=
MSSSSSIRLFSIASAAFAASSCISTPGRAAVSSAAAPLSGWTVGRSS